MHTRTAVIAALIAFVPSAAAQVSTPQLQQMRDAAAEGQVVEARRIAESITRDAEPTPAAAEALWLIAQLENGEGRSLRAAQALDRAADHAAAYGDPVMQARSLMEAAIIYVGARRYEDAANRIDRLRPLLASPFVSAELRDEAARRLHLAELPAPREAAGRHAR